MIRTRFAPSPTGYMHIGNLRTALFEFLIAKKSGGKFVLRIEDTDQQRFVDGAVEVIFDTLKTAGIDHDEGPDIEGDFGPYIQSLRKDIYIDFAKKLVDSGKAYYCFCDKERLDSLRNSSDKGVPKYDRHCLNLSQAEIDENLKNNVPFVIRQKIPTGVTCFEDKVYGTISIDNSEIEDQILIKSDGLPTYNFANVVDDHLMQITHVVRGSEYLTSTPKYNLLYDAFGWEIPTYIHLPPVMKDKQEKLSKRNGDASFQDLIEKGFLPKAIINYIALLGWAPKDNTEVFSMEQLIEAFDISGISKSPAIFDIDKLTWLNSLYIKNMDDAQFFEISLPIISKIVRKPYDLKKIASFIKSRISTISFDGIVDFIDFIEEIPKDYSVELFVNKKMKSDLATSVVALEKSIPVLQNIDDWSNDTIFAKLSELAVQLEFKNATLLWAIRTALSGKISSPCGASEMAELFGKDETICRIKFALEKLAQNA